MSTLNAIGPRQSRLARRNALVLALLATLSLSACGGDEDGDEAAGAPEMGTSAPPSGPSPPSGDQNATTRNGIPIRITFGNG